MSSSAAVQPIGQREISVPMVGKFNDIKFVALANGNLKRRRRKEEEEEEDGKKGKQ